MVPANRSLTKLDDIVDIETSDKTTIMVFHELVNGKFIFFTVCVTFNSVIETLDSRTISEISSKIFQIHLFNFEVYLFFANVVRLMSKTPQI